MKIVVIGGTGLIGSKTVAILRQGGHEVVAASPNTGVNTITGEGLKEAMAGTQVVIDLANSPSFEDKAVLEFFETSGRNLLAAEAAAGVRHHVALSIVGTDRTPDNGYFRAKVAQEQLIEASGIPYTIIRSTPSSWNSSAAIARFKFADGKHRAGFRPACSSRSRRTTWRPSSPRWRWRRRDAAWSRSPARDQRPRSSNSSPRCLDEAVSATRVMVVQRPGGPILRRPGRGALTRAVGRRAPWPHRFRRMASPLTGSALILHPRIVPNGAGADTIGAVDHDMPSGALHPGVSGDERKR